MAPVGSRHVASSLSVFADLHRFLTFLLLPTAGIRLWGAPLRVFEGPVSLALVRLSI